MVTIPAPSPAPTFTAAPAAVDRAPVREPEPGSWPEQPALLGPIPVSAPAEPEPEQAPAADPIAAPAAAPAEASPEDPSIEICAAIAASIARRPDRAAEVLREREMDPGAWARHDKRWREAIREERCRGKSDLRRAHDAAFVAQLERERGPITPVELSELTVATERGVRPAALAKLGLPAEALMPVERVMLARSLADPELRASLRAALAAARRA